MRASASRASASAALTLPGDCSLPTLALASAHSGESLPPSNGAPVMIVLLPAITRSISNFGARIPAASDCCSARSRCRAPPGCPAAAHCRPSCRAHRVTVWVLIRKFGSCECTE